MRQEPGAGLQSVEDAAEFAAERGVCMRTAHDWLPSLFAAIEQPPFAPEAAGFGQWPADAWWWPDAIAARDDFVELKLVEGKSTFVHERLWPAACAAIATQSVDVGADELRLVELLWDGGPRDTSSLRVATGWSGKEGTRRFHRARRKLESRGLIVKLVGTDDDASWDVWDRVFPAPEAVEPDVTPFVHACVRAAVICPLTAVTRWFPWQRTTSTEAVESLVRGGSLRQIELDGVVHLART